MLLNKVLKILIVAIMFSVYINCSNQKDQCLKRAETKGGEKYQDSSSACATYLVLSETARTSEEQGRSSFAARFLASEALAICIVKVAEERKCQSKSKYIPHFGD
ncbi:hypothetical protein EHQ59_16065 [Leptospira kemamanensis]|uniref:Uncharacterized protein n=1 Tax=Leptospira kemamanensis TaxID=2484942 RepID=A0A4R9JPR1_9LEPT|nr:hypothetical protein [Leptospira kemamanensis]TGL48225.1 hypothetical protein EHQ59_16065 [Leptospira kemamanensis]